MFFEKIYFWSKMDKMVQKGQKSGFFKKIFSSKNFIITFFGFGV